ncbi:MAG: serine protease [Brumimicrobium sp.]|nr:serine protease [Brumimicrobium sp.]
MKNKFLTLALLCIGYSSLFAQTTVSVSDKIEYALSAVVTVAVEKAQPIGKVLMGFRGDITEEAYNKSLELSDALGSGSGFIIQKNGKKYIITNAHVVENAADESGSLYVYSYNRKKYEVKVLGGDSFYDIAVLEFKDTPGKEFNILEFATKLPQIASKVYAIGNPLGEYPYTVTDGIVSAINRFRDGVTGKYGFIQSTATVTWGNSGGPLVNEEGQVVGINSQIAFAPKNGTVFLMQQINFALESPLALRIVNDIIEKGKLARAYIGIELKQRYKVSKSEDGWYPSMQIDQLPVLSNVMKGSDAANKLTAFIGWSITKINDIEVRSVEEALGECEKIKPNTKMKISLTDGTSSKDVTIDAVDLKPTHLEQLGSYMLHKIPNVSVDESSQQLKVYSVSENGYNRQKNAFYLIGGGNSDADDVWRITTLADLGSLLRIYGPKGGVEYFLIQESNYEQEPQIYTQNFDENDKFYQPMLWY